MIDNLFAKLGAIMYVLWGLLHLEAARKVFELGATLAPGDLQGRIYQNAWNLLFFAVFALAVGLWMNWKNNRQGYWLNLAATSAADVGFILFILIPGYVSLFPGIMGPVLWLLAVIFSTLGTFTQSTKLTGAAK